MDSKLIIFWSDYALEKLDDIYNYYSSIASTKATNKIIEGILASVENLITFPELGQKEKLLNQEPQGFRYVIYRQYKIIYWVNENKNRIEIVHVFNTRQNPIKLTRFKIDRPMKKQIILFTLIAFSFATQAQIVYSPNNYIEYHVGTVPIVLSAPHGGGLEPTNIPDRTCNNPTLVRDSRTRELALAIDSMFYLRTGCRIHLVICNLKRTKLDCNRTITDGACGNPDAEIAWTAFQHYIDSARQLAESKFAENFYIDLHGHGHTKQRLELGYLLWGSRLRNSDSTHNTPTFVGYSSIQDMVANNVNNYTHAELLRGPQALGTLLSTAGFPSVPSMQDIHPDTTDPFFSGGHNTRVHTCATPSVSANGLQIECNWTGVRDTEANRIKFADSLSKILIAYLDHHFNMNLNFCAPINTKNIEEPTFKIYPNRISAGEQLFFTKNISGATYQLFDLSGREIQAGQIDNFIRLSSHLSVATYFLQIRFKDKTSTHKIVVW